MSHSFRNCKTWLCTCTYVVNYFEDKYEAIVFKVEEVSKRKAYDKAMSVAMFEHGIGCRGIINLSIIKY